MTEDTATTSVNRPPGTASTMLPRRWFLSTGALLAVASSLVPRSYDEAYWLAVARLVEHGRVLYETALDNKTPPVYALIWLVEILPGPYQVTRAVVVALLGMWIMRSFIRLLAGGSPAVAVFLTVAMVLLAELQLAVELVAVALVLHGLVARSLVARVAACVAAAAFDPRAVLLFPGAVLVAPDDERRRTGAILAIVTATAVAVVLLTPDLRYGLIELNAASRLLAGDAMAVVRTAGIAAALLVPLVSRMRLPDSHGGWSALALGALVVPLVSLLPLPHYWIYLVAASAPFVGDVTRGGSAVLAAVLAVGGVAPVTLNAWGSMATNRAEAEEAVRIDAALTDAGAPAGAPYAFFGTFPHLVAARPAGSMLHAPASHYLADGTSRTDRYRRELDRALATAVAIVDDGSLMVPEAALFPVHRGTRRIFEAHLDRFPCLLTSGTVTIRMREPCP